VNALTPAADLAVIAVHEFGLGCEVRIWVRPVASMMSETFPVYP
jgi:hypothetical protein